MFVLYFMVLGIAAYGGDFIKLSIAGISFTYITMAALCVSYFKYFVIRRGKINLDKKTKAIIIFEIYGVLMVFFSFLGVNKYFISSDLYTSIAYIPRQAYYVVVLPALILMREEKYMKPLIDFLNKHGNFLFWIVYWIQIYVNRKFCISVSTVLILAGLALNNGRTNRNVRNMIKFLVITLTPVAVGGELTNIIIRLIYASIFLFRNHKQHVIKIMSLGFICMIVAIYILPLFSTLFENVFDANSFWRLRYWRDELEQLIQSHFLGVGYGTSYSTEGFVGQLGSVVGGPFGASTEYSTLDKLFVVGPHNSYIAIFFRLGLIGIVMFLYMLFSVNHAIKRYAEDILPVSVFLFFSSAVLIGVNVGLESPYYLLLFVLSVGTAIFETTVREKG